MNKHIWYHCSNNAFTEFAHNNNKTYKEFDIYSWFFTQDLNYAKTYGKFLYTVELSISNIFDTREKEHYEMFIKQLKEDNKTEKEIDEILDEQFFRDLPYWTCVDAFYAAKFNNFDSILISEELEKEVLSVAVFDLENIKIIKMEQLNETSIKESYKLKSYMDFHQEQLTEDGEFSTLTSIEGMGEPSLANRNVTGSGDVPSIAAPIKKKKKSKVKNFNQFIKE